ncbi:Vps36-domain-containing protein [Patellaria atrata CBS 101060]|uniref:Vacuolar protein-sorting-associated protein 36 n=1 Tax=Patellaria atrata CBS 101060 TaxID=1346257 RepID=A0A9P4VLI9_9PEZI|nr:Vps36-domain-containing protein [Patellaria atrata CBS 101060]
MFLRQIDLTTALRPLLLPDETLLFVQDSIGLYEGKYKIPHYQNGHAYLTSHRACYVDNEEPRKYSVAISLKEVERVEFYAGFLKSSPKVTFFPKLSKRASLSLRGPNSANISNTASPRTPPARYGSPAHSLSSPTPQVSVKATWICPICSFSNPVPSNFDPSTANIHTPLPPCLACGIKPPLVHVVKATISSMTNRQSAPIAPVPLRPQGPAGNFAPSTSSDNLSDPFATPTYRCPRCTFDNDPALVSCEMCGTSLVAMDRRLDLRDGVNRVESPGPSLGSAPLDHDIIESIKFSFRDGGEKIFHERLKGAMVQRKWLLESAPPVPKPGRNSGTFDDGPYAGSGESLDRNKSVGIAALERRGMELRKTNELVIGNAFEDLEALMTSAKEIIALAEQFASQRNITNGNTTETNALVSQSASALGLVTTKDMLGSGSNSLYLSELSRNLAEFLTDDARGILRKEGGIMSLVDLWAIFNRFRGGVELISPTDFEKAAQLWDKLKLPVRLRKFKSGLLAVQGRDRTDEKTIASLQSWLNSLHSIPPPDKVSWDWTMFGKGVTAQETAEHFGWSVGVATEELEMAEERGVLCREQSFDGLRFWENWIVNLPT